MRLDDDRWKGLRGGRGVPYDPRPALKAIEAGDANTAWDELWDNLHHQGDVGAASYAAVPEIVRLIVGAPSLGWRAYGLVAVIEESRLSFWRPNPPLPSWLEDDYRTAWRALLEAALRDYASASDPGDIESILAVLAFAKGQKSLGIIAISTESERQEILEELLGWPRDESEQAPSFRSTMRERGDD